MSTTLDVHAGASLRLPMSYADYQSLGETKHTEFYDGLTVMNPPNRRHAQIARRLTRAIEDVAPEGYEVLQEAGWLVAPATVLVPDVMVFRTDAPGEDLLREAPLLVVEITSCSTAGEDWHRKRELYALGGAPWYWIVEPEHSAVTLLRNDGSAFSDTGRLTSSVNQVAEPFPVTLDFDKLFS